MSQPPTAVLRAVTDALASSGRDHNLLESQPIGGGCTHNGSRIATADAAYFLKWNTTTDAPAMFEAEAEGLTALAEVVDRTSADAVVPQPLGHGRLPGGAWLLTEYVVHGIPLVGAGVRLGKALAAIHGEVHEPIGWPSDNWIGSLPQSNATSETWGEFWRDRRVGPQLELARTAGRARDDVFDRLLDAVLPATAGARADSLLHGDLWSGNAFYRVDGLPVLIDPAVYRGDGEVDLAMAELFGGFDTGVNGSYRSLRDITPEYESHRRALYQLYYLLVHLNLFGPSYEPGARAAAERVVAAVG
ncbi:MAG: fructosamine kinase family protein [Gemmatimonadota bacterium]